MELFKAIAMRKSTRKFNNEPISDDDLNKILAAGCASPVGRALKGKIKMCVVQDKTILADISAATSKLLNVQVDMCYGCQTLILICVQTPEGYEGADFANASCVAENMLLAATECGLGNVYLFGVPMAVAGDKDLRNKLNQTDGFLPKCAVALGHTDMDLSEERELSLKLPIEYYR